jgi:hypothetical protein
MIDIPNENVEMKKDRKCGAKTKGQTAPLLWRYRAGRWAMSGLEQEIHARARKIQPAAVDLLYWQLVLALWLLLAKVRARRGKMLALLTRLAKAFPALPGRSELDLWIRLVLAALVDIGALPTRARMAYRRDCQPLYGVTEKHVRMVATKYGSLRAIQREFCKPKPRPPEKTIAQLVAALRRILEENPDTDLPADIHAEFSEIKVLMAKRAKRKPTK